MIVLALVATVVVAAPAGSALLGGKLQRGGSHLKSPLLEGLLAPPDTSNNSTGGAHGPDLIVDQIYSITTIDGANETAFNTIYAEVFNQGDAAAGPSELAIGLRDAPSIAASSTNVSRNYTAQAMIDVAPLGAHEARTIEIPPSMYAHSSSVPGAFGVYRVEATVDATNTVPETNEGNNFAFANVFGGEISTADAP